MMSEPQLLQRLVYVSSQIYELRREEQERAAGTAPKEDEMTVRYLACLTRICLRRNAFHVAVGYGHLLYAYPGEAVQALYDLVSHTTSPQFVYAHDWDAGDLLIYDNRCLLHAATWYDAEQHTRIMWRTTVSGNPGPEYAGERRSWVPAEEGTAPMQGLEDLKGWVDVKHWERA